MFRNPRQRSFLEEINALFEADDSIDCGT